MFSFVGLLELLPLHEIAHRDTEFAKFFSLYLCELCERSISMLGCDSLSR